MKRANDVEELESLINNKKVFVFDFDGVVAHTERLQWEAYNIVFKKHNIEIDKEKWITYIGNQERAIYKMIKRDFNVEFDEESILEERYNLYMRLVKEKELKPFPLFLELLNKYTEVPYYILTSNREDVVREMLGNWSILNRFEDVISVSGRGITKRDALVNAEEYFKVSQSDMAYFEDMDKNLKVANELGITAIGIEHEFNYKRLENCDIIISGEYIIKGNRI